MIKDEKTVASILSGKNITDENIEKIKYALQGKGEQEAMKELEKYVDNVIIQADEPEEIKGFIYMYVYRSLMAEYKKEVKRQGEEPKNIYVGNGRSEIKLQNGEVVKIDVEENGNMYVKNNENKIKIDALNGVYILAIMSMEEGAAKDALIEVMTGQRNIATLGTLNAAKIRSICLEKFSNVKDGNIIKMAVALGIDLEKKWTTQKDERVRVVHEIMDGEKKGIKENFSNGAAFPRDASLPLGEKINCRCSVEYKLKG